MGETRRRWPRRRPRTCLQRLTHPNDNRSAAERSAHATMAAAKAVATQHWRKMERRRFAFGDLADLDRMRRGVTPASVEWPIVAYCPERPIARC